MGLSEICNTLVETFLLPLYGVYALLGLILLIAGIFFATDEASQDFVTFGTLIAGGFMLVTGGAGGFASFKKIWPLMAIVELVNIALFIVLIAAMMVALILGSGTKDPNAKLWQTVYGMDPVEASSAQGTLVGIIGTNKNGYTTKQINAQLLSRAVQYTQYCSKSDVKAVVDGKTWAKYSLFRTLDSNPGLVPCPRGCNWFAFIDEGVESVECGKCPGFIFCPKCRQIVHKNKTCEEAERERKVGADDKAFMEMAKQAGWKPCPSCGEFNAGKVDANSCDHVTCPKCAHEFCFVCEANRKVIVVHANHYHKPNCVFYSYYDGHDDTQSKKCPECVRLGELCPPPPCGTCKKNGEACTVRSMTW